MGASAPTWAKPEVWASLRTLMSENPTKTDGWMDLGWRNGRKEDETQSHQLGSADGRAAYGLCRRWWPSGPPPPPESEDDEVSFFFDVGPCFARLGRAPPPVQRKRSNYNDVTQPGPPNGGLVREILGYFREIHVGEILFHLASYIPQMLHVWHIFPTFGLIFYNLCYK